MTELPLQSDAERALIAAAEARERAIANCHEEVECPRCGAPIGVVCRNVTRSYQRGRSLKHPHRERWTQVVAAR